MGKIEEKQWSYSIIMKIRVEIFINIKLKSKWNNWVKLKKKTEITQKSMKISTKFKKFLYFLKLMDT